VQRPREAQCGEARERATPPHAHALQQREVPKDSTLASTTDMRPTLPRMHVNHYLLPVMHLAAATCSRPLPSALVRASLEVDIGTLHEAEANLDQVRRLRGNAPHGPHHDQAGRA